MNSPEISTKEYKVVDAISRNPQSSQRDISNDVGLSLGLTNILITRLAKKGYLKAKKINARRIRYIITPKGIKEQTKKTYKFMKRSLKVVSKIKKKIENFAIEMYGDGLKKFIIIGNGELSDITEIILKAMQLRGVSIEKKLNYNGTNKAAIFNTTSDKIKGSNVIDILNEAGKLYGSSYEL